MRTFAGWTRQIENELSQRAGVGGTKLPIIDASMPQLISELSP